MSQIRLHRLIPVFLIFLLEATVAWSPRPAVQPEEKTILFVSDTQSPIFWEYLILARNDNERATRKILDLILQEPDPAAVFHLGDAVAWGSSDEDWRPIDDFLARLRGRGVPVYGVMGNHEYMNSAAEGVALFKRHFPEFPQSWYSVRIASLAAIVINSNFDELSELDKAAQKKFYEERLQAFEADPEVRGIIVCAHDPPYTNSKIVSPSLEVEREFVPLFLSARKTKLFLSGHSHAAEDLVPKNKDLQGKHFLVLGGGGGLLHPLYLGRSRRIEDRFPLQTERRWFHYVRLTLGTEGLKVTYRILRQDLQSWLDIYEFAVPWD